MGYRGGFSRKILKTRGKGENLLGCTRLENGDIILFKIKLPHDLYLHRKKIEVKRLRRGKKFIYKL